MPRRTKQQWRELIEQQAQSGLSIAEFARQHQLSAKSFYARKSDFKLNKSRAQSATKVSAFIPVSMSAEQTSNTHQVDHPIHVAIGQVRLQLPASVDPIWLAQFIKATQP